MSGEAGMPGLDGYVGVKTGLALAPVRMAIGSCMAVDADADDAAVAGCAGNCRLAASSCWSRLERALS